ncbi:hypothetical protein Q9R46_02290 [Paenibacillus sp. RRE4]|uniref:hypothetical protein n=1 Tax=Paenibacillus sp. RRE4 TaxID=2962587 RepID=UPI002882A04B|nr:hypothetical protein [Paenibacillus sp. RRE4]MDT0121455.1 hypothetical protein [Paenibacillus sp. RRE4]
MEALYPIEMDYYYTPQGKPNAEVQAIGDCYTRNIFFMLKNELKNSNLSYKMFLDDFNLKIVKDLANYPLDVKLNDIKSPEDYVIKSNQHTFNNDASSAIDKLETLLANGEVVFVNTFMKKVPYYKTYELNSAYETDATIDGHIFLILGQTDTDFYFLDNYINYNPQFFKPHLVNKGIGQDTKRSFMNAFNHQFNCFTIHPNQDELQDLPDRAPMIFKRTLENYYKPDSIVDGYIECFGRSAILELNNLLASGLIPLNRKIPNRIHDAYSLLHTILNRHCDRKKVLISLLSSSTNPNALNEIIQTTQQAIKQWDLLRKYLTKQYLTNNFTLSHSFEKRMNNALLAEDQFFQSIEKNIDTLNRI